MNSPSDLHLAPTKLTRRRLLQGSANAAILMPPDVQRALGKEPRRQGSLSDIKHVIVLMQENYSFDHYFGTLSGVRGFDDPNVRKLPNGQSVFHQPDTDNPSDHLLPLHLDTHSPSAQKIPPPDMRGQRGHEAWNSGKMDQWLQTHRKADGKNGPYGMGYDKREDIPFQFALAGYRVPRKAPALPHTVGALNFAWYSAENLPKPVLSSAEQEPAPAGKRASQPALRADRVRRRHAPSGIIRFLAA